MQGFPCYFRLPVNYTILLHKLILFRFWVLSYFADLPHLNCRFPGLLALCVVNFLWLPSDPTVVSNALAIRILFPLIWVRSASLCRLGLPATQGKQKSRMTSSCFLGTQNSIYQCTSFTNLRAISVKNILHCVFHGGNWLPTQFFARIGNFWNTVLHILVAGTIICAGGRFD